MEQLCPCAVCLDWMDIRDFGQVDLEFLVRLIIVDNAERTVEYTFRQKGFDIRMKRYMYWAVKLASDIDRKDAALKIIKSGELANLNKEWVYVKINGDFYSYSKERGLMPAELKIKNYLVTCDQKNFVGESRNYKVYLFYEPNIEKLKNIALTLEHAKSIGSPGKKRRLVFAPTKYLDQAHLDELRIDFAQLPFEIYELAR